MSENNSLQKELEKLRNKLLDIGGRNPLISFRHSNRSKQQIRIIDELPDQIVSELLASRALKFKSLPDPDWEPEDEKNESFQNAFKLAKSRNNEYLEYIESAGEDYNPKKALEIECRIRDQLRIELNLPQIVRGKLIDVKEHAHHNGINPSYEAPRPENEPKKKHCDEWIQTLNFREEMDAILQNIMERCRLSESETGVNTLYLALGFLRWFESKESKIDILSPLLLLPVQIDRKIEDSKYQFRISSRDDEIYFNACLAERLKRDFGFILPEFNEDDSCESYYNRVQTAIGQDREWDIRRFVTLGFFSFSKIAMHADLGNDLWTKSLNDSLVDSLFRGEVNASENSMTFAADYYPDEASFLNRNPTIVLDADTSQISAMIDVMEKKNIVIEGPPGAGKSQTIANMIAVALGENKTVLFVAEKIAALEAVKKYLDRANLGLFCLELHSNKTKKQEVLNSFSATIKSRSNIQNNFDISKVKSRQDEIRKKISDYLIALNKFIPEIGLTTRHLIAKYMQKRSEIKEIESLLKKIETPSFKEMTVDRFNCTKQSFEKLVATKNGCNFDYSKISSHPWYGIGNHRLNALTIDRCINELNALNDQIVQLPPTKFIDMQKINSVKIKNLTDVLTRVTSITDQSLVSVKKFTHLDLEESRIKVVKHLLDKTLTLKLNIMKFSNFFEGEVDILNFSDESLQFLKHIESDLTPSKSVEEIQGDFNELSEKYYALKTINDFAISSSNFGFKISKFEHLLPAFSLLKWLDLNIKTFLDFRGYKFPHNSLEVLKQAESTISRQKMLRDKLKENFRLDLNLTPINIRQASREIEEANIFSIFSKKYRVAKVLISDLGGFSKKSSLAEKTSVLSEIAEYYENKLFLEGNNEFKVASGPFFYGELTPAHNLVSYLSFFANIETSGSEIYPIKDLALSWCEAATVDQIHGVLNNYRVAVDKILNTELSTFHGLIAEGIKKCEMLLIPFQTFIRSIQKLAIRPCTTIKDLQWANSILEEIRIQTNAVTIQLNDIGISYESMSVEELESSIQSFGFLETILSLPILHPMEREMVNVLVSGYWCPIKDELNQILIYVKAVVDRLSLIDQVYAHGNLCQRFDVLNLHEVSLTTVSKTVNNALKFPHQLTELVSYLRALENCRSEFSDYLLKAWETHELSFDLLPSSFEFQVYEQLLDINLSENSQLFNCSGLDLENLRQEFQKNDRELLKLNSLAITTSVMARNLPPGITRGSPKELTEKGLIDHELSKKSRHISVRELIRRSPNSTRALKPCFMMSPLSVSQYLHQDIEKFDLVIMDEASQLKKEDVVGSLLRAKQAVIVGDPKQLPPTSFFDSADNVINDDVDNSDGHESILDQALLSFKPARRLRWHYRSRHQSLIAYSNKEFYDSELIIFPSPNESSIGFGFNYVRVDGIYEARQNFIEAEKIVALAIEHMYTRPNWSLGIVAMNQTQKDLIRDLLEAKQKLDPLIQVYIQNWEVDAKREPFFIKNLENVQGDERDVILVSTVYGKDSHGNFYQRFGPINSSVGHRRLNVLFTRAKCCITVVTSFDPDWITVDKSASRGKNVLKGYMEYAKTGRLPTMTNESGHETDSIFEDLVIAGIKDAGFEAVPQIGVAGYFIDIGIRHPNFPGKFILGIECDGATYHSAKSARDRDRLRQENLERLGWKIHRIWSSDWFLNPKQEVSKIVESINKIISSEKSKNFLKVS